MLDFSRITRQTITAKMHYLDLCAREHQLMGLIVKDETEELCSETDPQIEGCNDRLTVRGVTVRPHDSSTHRMLELSRITR